MKNKDKAEGRKLNKHCAKGRKACRSLYASKGKRSKLCCLIAYGRRMFGKLHSRDPYRSELNHLSVDALSIGDLPPGMKFGGGSKLQFDSRSPSWNPDRLGFNMQSAGPPLGVSSTCMLDATASTQLLSVSITAGSNDLAPARVLIAHDRRSSTLRKSATHGSAYD
eukprot:757408-Hanusia_phi.AAC.9